MLAWEFIYQKNRNSVTYERDDQLLREVKYNKYNKKLKTTVNHLCQDLTITGVLITGVELC